MSYDLDIYLAKPTELTPPDPRFAAESPAQVEPDDIPETYAPLIARRRWLVRLHIQGTPDTQAYAAFESWLTAILAETKGIVLDEQTGRWQTAQKTGALPNTPADTTKMGAMSFFLTDANGFHAHGLAQMLDAIKSTLSDALPARFGQFEPLQGKVEKGDTAPLLQAFGEDPDQFLKARTPFAHIYLNVPCDAELAKWHPDHHLRKYFLATRVTFELRPKAFDDPRLIDLFKAISSTLNVFYSEIRRTDCPTPAWFWTGIPKGPVEAFCLGAPYTDLWPDAVAKGLPLENGGVMVAPTRTDPALPKPPRDLAAANDGYAETFPFSVPNT